MSPRPSTLSISSPGTAATAAVRSGSVAGLGTNAPVSPSTVGPGGGSLASSEPGVAAPDVWSVVRRGSPVFSGNIGHSPPSSWQSRPTWERHAHDLTRVALEQGLL